MTFCSIGGSSARPASRIMPTMKIITSAMTRLRVAEDLRVDEGVLAAE